MASSPKHPASSIFPSRLTGRGVRGRSYVTRKVVPPEPSGERSRVRTDGRGSSFVPRPVEPTSFAFTRPLRFRTADWERPFSATACTAIPTPPIACSCMPPALPSSIRRSDDRSGSGRPPRSSRSTAVHRAGVIRCVRTRGGIGRRSGLKSRGRGSGVRVRAPPGPPFRP